MCDVKAWAVVTKRGPLTVYTGGPIPLDIHSSKWSAEESANGYYRVVPIEIRILGKKKRRGKS